MNTPLKIVIADDNKFFCDALKDSLELSLHFEVVATFSEIDSLIEYTRIGRFDILILDINFNGESSLDYFEAIKPKNAEFKIAILTSLNNNFIKNQALDLGIDLVMDKNSDLADFKKVLLDGFEDGKRKQSKFKIQVDGIDITKRKLEILQALYQYSGYTEKEIAQQIHISESSLKSHKKELFLLTNTHNTLDLIKFGIEKGLILV